jgi:predicted transcriptional regulator
MADTPDGDDIPVVKARFDGRDDVFQLLADQTVRIVLEQLASGPKTATDIMTYSSTRAKLPIKRMAELLDHLADLEMVEVKLTGDRSRLYRISAKGFEPVSEFLARIVP